MFKNEGGNTRPGPLYCRTFLMRRFVSEKGACRAPGARAIESAAGIVDGQEIAVDPMVVFLGCFVCYFSSQCYRVGWSGICQCLEMIPHVAGGGFGYCDDQAIVAGIETGRGQLARPVSL